MPNVIKYSTTIQPNTIKKGNVLLGVNTVDYGPTSTTGFWNGVIPQTSGYTIYVLNTANTSPSIIQISGQSNADTWLPSVGGFNITGFTNSSQYFNTFLSNTMLSNKNYENIVTSGLVMNLDATYLPSYYGGGDLWTDLNGRVTTPNSVVRNFAKPLNEWLVIRSNVSEVTDGSVPPPFTGAKVWKSQTSSSFPNTLHRMWGDGNANGITWGLGLGYTRYYMWVRGETTNSTNCSVNIDISDAALSSTVVIGRNTNWTLISTWDINAGSYNASKFFDLEYPTQTSGDIYYISSIVVAAYSAVSMSQLISFPGYLNYSQTGLTYNQGLLVNGPTYLPSLDGAINFDGSNDYCDFVCTGLTTTATIEMVCRIGSGYSNKMFFGWNAYDVYCVNGGLGYNTGVGDLYGINSTQVTSLGLVNNWKHYVFEMRSDVSYSNNKIYVNGSGTTLSQQVASEGAGNRNFNNGLGRIALWRNGSGYEMPMDLTYFRVYNRSLSESEILQNYYQSSIVTSGMVLNLDAANIISYPKTGTVWTDTSPYKNNCSIVNGAFFRNSNGGAISLDGTNDLVYVPGTLSGFTYNIHYDLNWSIETWMYTYTYDATPQTYKMIYGNYNGCNYINKGNGQGIIIYGATTPASISLSLSFGPNNNGCPDVSVAWSNAEVGSQLTNLQNRWAHFVMTSDDGTNYRVYIDGVQVGPTKTVNFKGSQNRIDNTLPATSNYAFGGQTIGYNQVDFSQCRIYNRTLSLSEIRNNYNVTRYKFQ